MNYDYLTAMVADILEWIRYNEFNINDYDNVDDAAEEIYDMVWDEDAVTGNGAYGYAKRIDYENYLCHNWDLLIAAIQDFCVDMNDIINLLEKQDVTAILQYCDTLIRLNLLSEAIAMALDKINNKKGI